MDEIRPVWTSPLLPPINTAFPVPCLACDTSGKMTCKACAGRKEVACRVCRGSGKVEKYGVCTTCDGRSRVKCPDCNGDGGRHAMNPAKREAIERALAKYDDCRDVVTVSYEDEPR